jgi:hypothetical protein
MQLNRKRCRNREHARDHPLSRVPTIILNPPIHHATFERFITYCHGIGRLMSLTGIIKIIDVELPVSINQEFNQSCFLCESPSFLWPALRIDTWSSAPCDCQAIQLAALKGNYRIS